MQLNSTCRINYKPSIRPKKVKAAPNSTNSWIGDNPRAKIYKLSCAETHSLLRDWQHKSSYFIFFYLLLYHCRVGHVKVIALVCCYWRVFFLKFLCSVSFYFSLFLCDFADFFCGIFHVTSVSLYMNILGLEIVKDSIQD